MSANKQYRFVLVSRKTRLQELVERFNTWPQAKFYLEHNQVDGQDYFDENAQYQQCLTDAEQTLKALGRFQSSSGVIISTGFGSTGWLQSILAGARGVVGGKDKPLSEGFGWGKQRLQFAVREPFPSNTTGTSFVFGQVTCAEKLTLESFMPENGVVFSDGIQGDYLAFNSGCIVTVGVSDTVGRLVV